MYTNLCKYELMAGEEIPGDKRGVTFNCPQNGLDLCIYRKGSDFSETLDLKTVKYLVLEAEILEEYSMCFQVNVYTSKPKPEKEADFRMIFGMLPRVNLTVPIDLKILDSQNIFPERSSGRLKMTVFGKSVRVEEIEEIHITTMPYVKEHQIIISNLEFTNAYPDIILEDKKLMDELGQWIPGQWDKKIQNRSICNDFLKQLLRKADEFDYTYSCKEWDEFGGWILKPLTKTGWFHTEFDGTRWWMVDPMGNAFISTGIDCMNPGTDTRIDIVRPWCSFIPDKTSEYLNAYKEGNKFGEEVELFNYGIANLIAAFGVEKYWSDWAKILKMYLYQWGVNTIGNWSDINFIRYAKMPYVLPLDRYSVNGYPTTKIMIFRDFPDVFHEEYRKSSDEYANALKKFREDKYLIGYFMRNEPAWAFVYDLNIAEEMLANPFNTASKEVFINEMRVKYNTIQGFNLAWNLHLDVFEDLLKPINHASLLSEQANEDLTKFSKEMITRYVSLPAKACRKIDKNHMNLGMRYAYITDTSLLSGFENFDVFSINSYQFSPYEEVENIGNLLNMPVILGEFHHGALDQGLTAHGIKGVKDQKDRGRAYRYYVEQGAKSKYFLGAHYFQLNDQSCLGRFDGENYQIGILDICMQEYSDMIEAMKETHSKIYEVSNGDTQSFSDKPEYVPPIHY